MHLRRTYLGINLVMLLLAVGGIYSITIGVMTMLEYLPTEFAGAMARNYLFNIALGLFTFLLIYGLAKRRSWALLATIAFMCFGIVSAIIDIIYTRAFEIPSTIGIAGLILFSAALYYLTRPHVRKVFQ